MPKKSIAEDMEKLKQRRDDRKKKAEDDKIQKNENVENNTGASKIDVQFEKMVKKKKESLINQPDKVEYVIIIIIIQFTNADNAKIMVCVRVRPIFKKEVQNGNS